MSASQERVKALLETRATVHAEATGFLEDLKGAEMSEEQRTQYDRYNARIDVLASEADELTLR